MMANLQVGYVCQQIADIHLFYLPLPGNQCLGAEIGNWRRLLCNLFSLFSSWFSSFSLCVVLHRVFLYDSFSSFHNMYKFHASLQFITLEKHIILLHIVECRQPEHFCHRYIIIPPSKEGITMQ